MDLEIRMRRDARLLKGKAISSLRRSVNLFNGLDDDGHLTSVLLHAEHSAEMLIKSSLRGEELKEIRRIFWPKRGLQTMYQPRWRARKAFE
jgi:hypothetical protein